MKDLDAYDDPNRHIVREPEIDLAKRFVTMSLENLADLLDANAMIEYGHDNGNGEIREQGIRRHQEILTGLGLTDRELTELDDTAAVGADAWMPDGLRVVEIIT